jgi:hypothetical protein
MSSYPKIIVRLIGISGVGFNNAKNTDEIKAQLVPLGYDDAKLDAMLELNSRMDETFHTYETKYGEQLHATRALEEKFKEEMTHYLGYRRMASLIFTGLKDKGIRSQLGIDVKTKTSFNPFIEQAKQFYDVVVKKPEILARLSEFGVTLEKMQERLDEFNVLRRLDEDQESKKGAALGARKERDEAFNSLGTAWTKFRTACGIVFKENPDHRKALNADEPIKLPQKTTVEEPVEPSEPSEPTEPTESTEPTEPDTQTTT